jgi:hypothetical protein
MTGFGRLVALVGLVALAGCVQQVPVPPIAEMLP